MVAGNQDRHTSCSMYWRELDWKNLVLNYPKMKTYSLSTNHTCWRNCGDDEANHHHTFWSCAKIQLFGECILESHAAYFWAADPTDMRVTVFG